MASNIYSEIKPELRWIADELEETRLTYKIYNKGVQYNVTDNVGNIHSYYPTTGTILLHDKNIRGKSVTLYKKTVYEFINIVTNSERVNQLLNRKGA